MSNMRFSFLMLLIITFSGSIHAQNDNSTNIQKGDDYYDKEDYKNAYVIFSKAANEGNSYAQNRLGLMYENGYGVEQDYEIAVNWYNKSAVQGNDEAQFYLGRMYDKGQGVKQDYAKAAEWYQKAAEKGNVTAQFIIGLMYYKGQGVKQDYTKAAEWYKKAAQQGYADAENNLGYCYEYGHGVTMDIQKAIDWYRKAIADGQTLAMTNLGFFYENGIGLIKDEKKAFSLYKQSAEKGCSEGQRLLAFAYYYAIGTPKDGNLALYWMNKAKEQGNKGAEEVYESLRYIVNNENGIYGQQTDVNSPNSITIIMNRRNYVYYVPCKINGLKADFIFDTGAGMISLSSRFAKQLVETGRLSENDLVGIGNSTIADGSKTQVLIANIKDVEIGGLHLYNVKATINEQQNAPLLLGQSAIEKLGKVTIDGYKLIIHSL